jgi:hypothetical protein
LEKVRTLKRPRDSWEPGTYKEALSNVIIAILKETILRKSSQMMNKTSSQMKAKVAKNFMLLQWIKNLNQVLHTEHCRMSERHTMPKCQGLILLMKWGTRWMTSLAKPVILRI